MSDEDIQWGKGEVRKRGDEGEGASSIHDRKEA